EAERSEERLGSAGAREAARLLEPVAEVEPHASASLRKREEVDVALGADRLDVVGPAMRVLDQHPREEVMRRVAVELDAELTSDLRAAAVGADDEPAARDGLAGVGPVRHLRRAARRDTHVLHAAP